MILKTIIIENTWLSGMEHGWGNGYVLLPKNHKYHGVHYDEIEVNVHGGLTYAVKVTEELLNNKKYPLSKVLNKKDIDKWIIGFDTCHGEDNQSNWSKEAVEQETENLKNQL